MKTEVLLSSGRTLAYVLKVLPQYISLRDDLANLSYGCIAIFFQCMNGPTKLVFVPAKHSPPSFLLAGRARTSTSGEMLFSIIGSRHYPKTIYYAARKACQGQTVCR